MIIFISDLHLTDGTYDYMKDDPNNHVPHDISHEAFKLFWDQVYRIYKANKGESKINEIKLVLLGDIVEIRSTTKWVASDYEKDGKTRKLNYRPWKEDKSGPSKICKEILEGILKYNEKIFRYLSPKKFDEVEKDNGLRLLVEELGKDKIKIEYVSGNHDRLINFYDEDSLVKKYIEKELGWTIPEVDKDRGFKFEDKDIGILADHGHKDDFIDYYKDYKKAPIGALLSDLLGRLMYHVQEKENKELIRFCMNIDNVRPSSDRLIWVATNINKLSEDNLEVFREVLLTYISELNQDSDVIFDFLYERLKGKIKFFHKVILGIVGIFTDKKKFLKRWITKILAKIERRLKETERKDLKTIFDGIQRLISKLMPKKKKKKEDQDQDFHYYKRDEKEREEGYNYVVYGHSHRFKLIPLTTQKERKVFYFNTGTWKRTVQKNLLPLKTKEPDFQKWSRMTYVNFFSRKRKENKDHIFDVWHGNLQVEGAV